MNTPESLKQAMQDEERTSLVRNSGQGGKISTVGRDEETIRNYIKDQE